MTRRTKQGRSRRSESASAVVRRPKIRSEKKAIAVTKWVASPAITAAMAAPQVMSGPPAFF